MTVPYRGLADKSDREVSLDKICGKASVLAAFPLC